MVNDSPALIHVTTQAATKIKMLINNEGNLEHKLRVYIVGGGCSGFRYAFAFEENAKEDDISIETQGAHLIIDPISLQYLIGAVIDYVDELDGSRFVVHNPHAKRSCSCGSSFDV